jgi:integrase
MVLFTGARKSELLNLQWPDVDLKGRTIKFRDTKNREDHDVPLSPEAVKLLRDLPRTLGNPHVFCGHKKGKPLNNPYKAWRRILKRAGIDRRVTIHDLRRTAGSLLATAGFSTQQIGKLLGHKSSITSKVYAEIADTAKVEMTGALAKMLR